MIVDYCITYLKDVQDQYILFTSHAISRTLFEFDSIYVDIC